MYMSIHYAYIHKDVHMGIWTYTPLFLILHNSVMLRNLKDNLKRK